MFVKKNIIVTNPSKIDVKQKEHETAKSLCYVGYFSMFKHVNVGERKKKCRNSVVLKALYCPLFLIINIFYFRTFSLAVEIIK